ncbi:uncharacterized protein EDB91DRAFT_1141138 [Suillus paluster]|uniref:uncharacterized protein n=1 Tax=Suillus paluster TaxID=48578 RepID=UPI001B87E87F|nr:uncharacterized protein EDB91DRAFT_1141138 [Suillus paluster]KAG1737122.1 hypothetical protein EDB91DRAFT_1141138 [Suillus paluster]
MMTSYSSSLNNGSTSASVLLNQGHFSSFSVPQLAPPRTTTYQAPIFASSSTSNPTNGPRAFKAPAHKHAHHLHSIPPREKSTRTLIIDHMLWVHGRTRFTQARAELGMTDRTGGPSSSNYRHRERPESYDEDDEVSSDGENVEMLKAREGGPGHPHNEDEENRRQKQDLILARTLRLRAIGLEKVVTSMLDQPPPVHPILDEDLTTPPTSPERPGLHQSPQRTVSHQHTLPNGVRLRLALGTVINDLFARQAPTPLYRHHHHPPPIIVSSNGSDQTSSNGLSPGSSPAMQKASPASGRGSSTSSAPGPTGSLPPSVLLLSQVSAAALPQVSLLPMGDFRALPPPMQAPQMVQSRNRRSKFAPNSRVYAMYKEGADPSTANSPPGLRCTRHLYTACEICVEAKQSVKAPGGSGRARATSAATGLRTFGDWEGGIGGSGGSMGGSGGGIAGWQDGPGIGSGLAQPGVDGSVLRRKSKWFMPDSEGEQSDAAAGNTRLSELIPRFLRLSALVAMELGEELGDDEYEGDWQRSGIEMSAQMPSSPRSLSRRSQTIEAPPLRPSREWYMLLAGLLARATLEGYLTGGWWGLEAVECLLSVGLGIGDDGFGHLGQVDQPDDADSAFAWFEPDDLPSLKEATRIMFPALRAARNGTPIRREGAEAEFEAEMDERLRRFYTIPSLTPDLSTHMEDLAWHYPAEPVERAALRFCEAIAKWRGKPELETYTKKQSNDVTASGSSMTIETLVHSNPTSPTMEGYSVQPSRSQRPPIEKYFIVPPSYIGRGKRRRSLDEADSSHKRVHG